MMLASCEQVFATTVYKCTIDGVLSFSDHPCGNNSEKIEVATRDTGKTKYDKYRAQLRKESVKLSADIAQLNKDLVRLDAEIAQDYKNISANKHLLRIGLSESDFLSILGVTKKAFRVNKTITVNGNKEQWIYGSSGNRTYYYFNNGYLTAIQTR
jgi:hypothetical protein